MAQMLGRPADPNQATPAQQPTGAAVRWRPSAAPAGLKTPGPATAAQVVVAGQGTVMGAGMGVGVVAPNQATIGTMVEAAQGARVVAARGVLVEPARGARGAREAGDLEAQAAPEGQGRGVLDPTRATTHDTLRAQTLITWDSVFDEVLDMCVRHACFIPAWLQAHTIRGLVGSLAMTRLFCLCQATIWQVHHGRSRLSCCLPLCHFGLKSSRFRHAWERDFHTPKSDVVF